MKPNKRTSLAYRREQNTLSRPLYVQIITDRPQLKSHWDPVSCLDSITITPEFIYSYLPPEDNQQYKKT